MLRTSTILLTFCAVTALSLGSPRASEPLTDGAQVEALCTTATPATSDSVPIVEYLATRRARLVRTYSAVLPSGSFALGRYEAEAGLLHLVTDEVAETEAGPIVLGPEPLTFSVADDTHRAIVGHAAAARLAVRVTFGLEALWAPEHSYCVAGEGPSRPTLRGRLLAAEILVHGEPKALARLETKALAELTGSYGQSPLENGRHVPSVRVEIAHATSQSEGDDTKNLAVTVEELLFPCFLGALSSGGPSKAALVLEVNFASDGAAQSSSVAVDATGYPTLGECSRGSLRHLRVPASSNQTSIRFTAFFELR